LSIVTVSNLVTDGCKNHAPLDPPVGPKAADLTIALNRLRPFKVISPPANVKLLGYEGYHLELAVPALRVTGPHDPSFPDCVDGELHSWIAPINEGPFRGYDGPGQTEGFWILDVGATRLVLVKFDSPQSPAQDIAERDAIFDSIRIAA
jgi:hypothetical protein